MMKIINLTPHKIVVCGVHYPSAGVARVEMSKISETELHIGGSVIPVNRSVLGAITGLPAAITDTIYIVSRVVAEHPDCRGRDDIYIVDETIRDNKGRIVGCAALGRI